MDQDFFFSQSLFFLFFPPSEDHKACSRGNFLKQMRSLRRRCVSAVAALLWTWGKQIGGICAKLKSLFYIISSTCCYSNFLLKAHASNFSDDIYTHGWWLNKLWRNWPTSQTWPMIQCRAAGWSFSNSWCKLTDSQWDLFGCFSVFF